MERYTKRLSMARSLSGPPETTYIGLPPPPAIRHRRTSTCNSASRGGPRTPPRSEAPNALLAAAEDRILTHRDPGRTPVRDARRLDADSQGLDHHVPDHRGSAAAHAHPDPILQEPLEARRLGIADQDEALERRV